MVRDQAVTLLFAGHDTTTTTFTFLIHELGRNPGVRSAVEDELEGVVGDRAPSADLLDGQALPVLERSLKETLRCYPAAWVGPRRTTRDVTLGRCPGPGGDRRPVLLVGHPSPTGAVSRPVPVRPGPVPPRA